MLSASFIYQLNETRLWTKECCPRRSCNGLKKVRKTSFAVATYPTGLDELLEQFKRAVLQQQQPLGEPKVVVIVGLGGIGKTTLAKAFFNSKRSDYYGSSFLFDVRETSLIQLQNKLVKDLIPLDPKIDSIADGVGKLIRYLHDCQALVVLDDVDNVEQLDALFSPVKAALRSDSLIIITSRNKDILSRMKESSIYMVRGLNEEQSQELFCWHAFHQPCPLVGFEEIVGAFLYQCDGLPLSLKVVGALLYEKNDLKYWKEQLCKISRVLPTDIQSRLKVSYDNLDHQEKQIFLDITCFFIGKDRDTAIRIWDGSGWQGSLGLVNLENKCLIEIDHKKRLRVHHHLRDLGRDLADKEPPGYPRRLWLPTNNVFIQSSVRGVSILEQISGQSTGFNNRSVDMPGLQLLKAEGDCLASISNIVSQSDLIRLRWDRCPHSALPSWIPLRNLRVLEVAGGQLETLWQGAEAPLELRELNIGTLLRFPRSIDQLKHLEKIVLEDIIQTLPEELFHLLALKHLKISTRMECLPESLGNLTNLQHIDFSNSMGLQRLPASLGNLTELQHINLNGCLSLQSLPHTFGNLSRLKHVCLAGCSGLTLSNKTLGNISDLESIDFSLGCKIEVLPLQVTHQRFLEEINLSMTMLKELPSDIGNLTNLEVLKLECPLLETLPPSLGNLMSLKELTFIFCPKLKSLPDSVARLKELAMLLIDCAGIEYLPVGVLGLDNLESLSVRNCPLLEMPFFSVEDVEGGKEAFSYLRECILLDIIVDKGMLRLKQLDLQGTKIKKLSFPQSVCPNLQHINISCCLELVEVGALPTTLASLNLNGCTTLKKIRGLCGLAQLRHLDIQGCHQLEELPGLETLISLEELRVSGCGKLKSIRGLAQCTTLRMPSCDDHGECDCVEKDLFEDLRLLRKELRGHCGSPRFKDEEIADLHC